MKLEQILLMFEEMEFPDADRWALDRESGILCYMGEWDELADKSEELFKAINSLLEGDCENQTRALLERMQTHLALANRFALACYCSWNGGIPRAKGIIGYFLFEAVGMLAPKLFRRTQRSLGVNEKNLEVRNGAKKLFELETEHWAILDEIDRLFVSNKRLSSSVRKATKKKSTESKKDNRSTRVGGRNVPVSKKAKSLDLPQTNPRSAKKETKKSRPSSDGIKKIEIKSDQSVKKRPRRNSNKSANKD